ncbi:MAG: toxin-antitoxin system HicB family antitoxin, partial [Candidatus Nitrosotenuis sp.]|nr:toxin-antitoxin system HicB family antitoxin [Candidatus Nitrosotenuis sp.]
MSAKKTASLTFRIDEKFEKVLRKTAKERRVSLNTLANQIF